jgi:hypothetical protein
MSSEITEIARTIAFQSKFILQFESSGTAIFLWRAMNHGAEPSPVPRNFELLLEQGVLYKDDFRMLNFEFLYRNISVFSQFRLACK